jgi:hypothetical protein
MPLCIVRTTHGVTAMVARATVSRIRKQDIGALIIANPLITTLCLNEFFGLTA